MYRFHPSVAWITVNRRCNFRCKWCYAKGTGYGADGDMPLAFAMSLARLAKGAGVGTILLIGGEPTLWPHVIEFNAYCAAEKLKSVLVTNGARFADRMFCEQYRERPCDVIGLSVKGTTPQQLFEVAGVKNFRMIEQGIRTAIREFGARVNITHSTLSEGRLTEMVRFVTDCGAKSVKIEFCSTTFAGRNTSSEFMADPRVLVHGIVRAYPELDRITDGRITFDMMVPLCIWPEDFVRDLHKKGRLLSVCHVHKRRGLIFDGKGQVIMCNALFDYPIGRFGREFNDADTFLAWFNNPEIQGLYDRIGNFPSLACKECTWYAECGGGCPLRWAKVRPDNIVRPMKNPLQARREK